MIGFSFFFLAPTSCSFLGGLADVFSLFLITFLILEFVKTLKKNEKTKILWQFHVDCTKRLLIDFAACFIMFLTLLCVKELLLCENIVLKTNINKKHAAEENLKLISNYI